MGLGDDGSSDGIASSDGGGGGDGAPRADRGPGPGRDASPDAPAVDNQRCSTPQRLALQNGRVEVSGDTTGSTNQFGTDISCDTTTTFDGAQRYYMVTLAAGKHYRVTLTPDAAFDGALYAFPASTGCSAPAIDAACAGYASDAQGDGTAEVVTIAPIVDQDWVIVVDSYESGVEGAFKLAIERFDAPTNTTCAKRQTLTLQGGSATVSSTTALSSNELGSDVDCGTSTGYDGPQVYYEVALQAGKHYRVSLTASGFDAALYAFPAAAGCSAAAINAGCAGYLSDATGSGKAEDLVLSPIVDQHWVIAVDAYTSSESGPFTLDIRELTPPTNATCAAPATLSLSGGAATVKGDTSLAVNQFGTGVSCGTPYDFDGAQVYYKVALQGGKHYEVRVTSSEFDTALYAFEASTPCTAAAINLRCTGAVSDDTNGKPDVITLSPTSNASYIIAVDSDWSDGAGAFSLSVKEIKLPGNVACNAPTTVKLSQGKAQISGDTSTSRDEFTGAIQCGSAFDMDGPQLYYKVALTGGKAYRLELTPSGFDAALYAFAAQTGCQAAAINTACTAHFSDHAGSTAAESLLITPATSGDYVVVVDSYKATSSGPFTLDIKETTAPSNVTCQSAKTLVLSGGQASASADTSLSSNEFGRNIDCGGTFDYDGPQLYYRVRLEAGKTYNVGLTPTSYDGSLYAFPASVGCNATAINTACVGHYAENASSGHSESLTISPSATGDWIIVADSWLSGEGGPMSLAILAAP